MRAYGSLAGAQITIRPVQHDDASLDLRLVLRLIVQGEQLTFRQRNRDLERAVVFVSILSGRPSLFGHSLITLQEPFDIVAGFLRDSMPHVANFFNDWIFLQHRDQDRQEGPKE